MCKKLAAFFFMAILTCALIPKFSNAEELPTGYIQSPIDRSHLDDELPILSNPRAKYPVPLRDTPLPVSYDMRNYGRVPPPREQYPWGTCWAFAAIGSLETAYITQNPTESVDLSEIHLAYFAYGDPRPGKSFSLPYPDEAILEQGGNADMSIAFLSRLGTVSESILPYSNASPDGLPEDYKPSGIRLKSAYNLASPSSDPDTIKRFIMETGAVQISYYNVYSSYYEGSSGFTTFYDESGGNSTNHAVLLVGWDDDFSRENFPEDMRPQNNGAWLVRNSWGDSWWSSRYGKNVGDNGCFWISYEQYMKGAAVFIPAKSENGLKHYGYDDLGYCSKVYSDWCANVFKAEGNETLKYIGFQTINTNTSYEIYIYDLGTEIPDSPVNGTLIASSDGYAPYEGYHTVDVDGRISEGHYFSVVMKNDEGFASEGVIYCGNGNLYSAPVCNPGESYSSYDGDSWSELSNNVCIKAFTIPDDSPKILTASLPDAFEGVGYSADIIVASSRLVSLDIVSGDFPEGLRMDGAGRISGTPSKAGTFTFTLRAWNVYGIDEKALTLKVNAYKNLKITPNTLSKAKWGRKYSKTLKVSGLKSPVWTVSGELPGGLSLNSSTGKLSGTVTGVGTFNFTATACNGAVVSKDYTLTVKGIKPKLKGSLPKGIVGTEYYAELRAKGTTPITWSIPNLPEGLALTVYDEGKLCVISGTPSEGNKKKVSVTLTSLAGSVKKNLSLKIRFTKPKITTPGIPEGGKGTAYYAKFEATGSPAITWRKSSGKLPKGITLSEDGTLSGVPEEAGDFTFKVQAKNGGGKASSRFTLSISESQNGNQSPDYGHDSAREGTSSFSQRHEAGNYGAATDAYGYIYFTAAVLPEISVDEAGMYEFSVSVDADVPDGLLVWRETPEAEDSPESENAIFLDDDGEVILTVPENRSVTVSAWLEPGKMYEPVIMVKISM